MAAEQREERPLARTRRAWRYLPRRRASLIGTDWYQSTWSEYIFRRFVKKSAAAMIGEFVRVEASMSIKEGWTSFDRPRRGLTSATTLAAARVGRADASLDGRRDSGTGSRRTEASGIHAEEPEGADDPPKR